MKIQKISVIDTKDGKDYGLFDSFDKVKKVLKGKKNTSGRFLLSVVDVDITGKVETMYTGGGIWIAAMYIDDSHYLVVDNDYEDLSLYDHNGEDEDSLFPLQNYITAWDESYMPDDKREAYNKLHLALMKAVDKDSPSYR